MEIIFQIFDFGVVDAVLNDPYFLMVMLAEGPTQKIFHQSMLDENKRVQYDVRDQNAIVPAVTLNEFYRILKCKSAKEMWDTVEVTHEGTNEVKRARKNTILQEYELLQMKQNESISDFQTRFTHIVNHLDPLGKSFINKDLSMKILK